MNAPTLLVGLGGTGCKIIERVSAMVTPEQRKNIACAVFDTDINDLRGIEERNPFIKTIQTSTKQTVGEYLNKDTHARDSWFPVNAILNGKTLTEGAGQVRSISRLALETVIRAGKMEPLHQAIQSLYKVEEDKAEQALRVVVVSSLAGGTGSGLLLPVALYIRNYLATNFRQSANITRGFFILPEVFYEVIEGQTERNNLKANAYAALRELDAFLMKGDNTLHERYKDSVVMQFPRAASMGYEEYDVRPYDFCFLFDAQNADGSKLNSFDQYLDHAANCIYAQSIGPMNKRSNSSEDNTIRKLAKERGRNRYAGAGASMLIYPFTDIKSFVALKWAKQTVSKQWLTFDNAYKEICQENDKSREEGINIQNPDPYDFYANQIESMSKQEDPFARAIVRSCGSYKADGVTRVADKWKVYVQAVMDKVKVDVEAGTTDLKSAAQDANEQINALGNDWEAYEGAYEAMEKYYLMSNVYAQEVSQTIAYTMFKAPKEGQVDKDKPYKLEAQLISDDGKFLHPNAMRYLLIKILELLKQQQVATNKLRDDNKKWFDNFEHDTFDNPETDEDETVADLSDRKVGLIDKITKKPTGEQEEMKRKFRKYYDNVGKYKVQCAQAYALSQGIDYVEAIIKAFDSFYKSFDNKVEDLDKNIAEIYKKFANSKGTTARYVCASRKCLDKLYEKMPYTGSSITIDSELSKEIYFKVLEYAVKKDKPNNNKYFTDLFDKGILGYFENSVMKSYGTKIDIDIITALENEAVYEEGYEDEINSDTLIEQYVVKTITDIKNLACPFIESPLGEVGDPINSCTFNISLKPEKGDESSRAQLIRKELMNFGGAPDEDIDKNMIMFYKSYYGLRANDLSKFAPPEKSLTYNRQSGEYFKAYYELVNGVHPETHRSKEITPHIDRWWHIVTKMPDLDDENQAKQEYDINAAFFWGIIGRYVDLFEDALDHKTYKLKVDALKMDDNTLTVSNGTECDKLYEVLDAIAIYPELVTKILDKVDTLVTDDINENRPVEEGILCSFLDTFYIQEPGLGREKKSATSIFTIPLLMKKSATPDIYYEENVVQILKVELGEIKKYLSKFCTGRELPEIMGRLVMSHFEKYLEDVAVEAASRAGIYRESLFDRTCSIIAEGLEEIGLKTEARAVLKKAAELRK
ncbi:MAG: hypothetical protein IKU13_07295 [Clostridia bacterium]|nr:hypothetical protein [Clostridia bacterium]